MILIVKNRISLQNLFCTKLNTEDSQNKIELKQQRKMQADDQIKGKDKRESILSKKMSEVVGYGAQANEVYRKQKTNWILLHKYMMIQTT